MSDHPPATSCSSITLLDQPHNALLISTTTTTPSPPSSLPRQYRKGNWTLEETLVLITAKKLDDDRRARSATTSESKPPSYKSAELRWKWVENYCWNHGCFRSQNQCNDKWDNLLRDYKKVRDYETKPCSSEPANKPSSSYWKMEKHERKERNLPSNLLFHVFQALHDAVDRKIPQRSHAPDASTALIAPPPPPTQPPPPPPPSQIPQQFPSPVEMTVSSDTEGSGGDDAGRESDTKRRRKEGSLGSSVVRGASLLARTLLACEDKRDQRHQNVLQLEERKIQMEENRTQINRQGVAALITAVNSLSNVVQALVSDQTDTR